MIEPTERLLWAVVGAGVVGVCGFIAPAVGAMAPFVLLGVVGCVVVDVVLARSPSQVRVTRHCRERCTEGSDVVIDLEIRAPFGCEVEVTDTVPLLTPAWTTVRVSVAGDDTVTVHTKRRCVRRGDAGAGRFAVRTLGPLGLIRRRQRRDGAGDGVTVGVDVGEVLRVAERLVRGGDSGSRRKRAVERGRELDALREYRRGDDVRLVDWKASARRGELIVKDLVPESRQDVIVVLDAGRQLLGTTEHPDGPRNRFDEALGLGLVLAAAALEKGDRAGICLLDDHVAAWEPPREGRAQLTRLAEAVAASSATAVEPAYQEFAAMLVRRQKRRALVCIVTDVVDEDSARALARALAGLRGRHLVMVVALGDPGIARFLPSPTSSSSPSMAPSAPQASPAEALSPSLHEAATRLLAHRRRALAALQTSAGVVVDTVGGPHLPRARAAAVEAYMMLKSQGRL